MSSFPRSLATGGSESFGIWDSGSSPYNKIYSHCPPSGGSLSSLSWSADGSCLAALPKESKSISMTYSVKGILRSSELSLSSPIRAFSFPKNPSSIKSIWISLGANISQILLSNPRSPSKDYSITGLSHEEVVSRIALNVRDDAAVVATSRGRLKCVNLFSGFESPLAPPDDHNINDLRYNNVRHALLGSASDSGAVAFWDVHARKRLSLFNKHSSPASGIAFSPVNEMLVLSSGLDKKCICYDAKEKKPVSTISTEYPLTCVDFKADGFMLALGTSQGHVLIYDLRSYDAPIQDFDAHGTIVHAIKYAQGGLELRKSAPFLKASSLKESHYTAGTEDLSPIPSQQKEDPKNESLGSTHGFSPLRRDYTSSPLDLSSSRLGSNNISSDSMFSPLREGVLSNNSTLASSSITEREKGNHSLNSPALGLIREETLEIRSEIASKTKSMKDILSKTASIIKNDLKGGGILRPMGDEDKENNNNSNMMDSFPSTIMDQTPRAKESITSNSLDCQPDDIFLPREDVDMKHILTAFPSCLSLGGATSSDPLPGGSSYKALNSNHPSPGSFQHAYLQNVVKSTVQDYSRELSGLIWSSRYESIKLFTELSDKIEETVLEASPNAELLEENKKLREELETLKSYY